MLFQAILHLSVFATLFTASTAFTIPSKRGFQQASVAPSTANVGPYTIANCSAANNDIIATSLKNLATYLQAAIKDALASTKNPSPAFSTYFGSNATSAAFVAQVLTNITRGPSLYPTNDFSNGAPIFACLTAEKQMTASYSYGGFGRDIYQDLCEKSQDEVDIYSLTGTPWIIACPSLFTGGSSKVPYVSEVQAPSAIPVGMSSIGQQPPACPPLDTSKALFQGDGTTFSTTMPWILLETLVHYYVNGTKPLQTDVNDINQCVNLQPQDSVVNAHSYVYYVASIFNKCMFFPKQAPLGRVTLETQNAADANDAPGVDASYPGSHINGQQAITFGGVGTVKVTGAMYYNRPNADWPVPGLPANATS